MGRPSTPPAFQCVPAPRCPVPHPQFRPVSQKPRSPSAFPPPLTLFGLRSVWGIKCSEMPFRETHFKTPHRQRTGNRSVDLDPHSARRRGNGGVWGKSPELGDPGSRESPSQARATVALSVQGIWELSGHLSSWDSGNVSLRGPKSQAPFIFRAEGANRRNKKSECFQI